MSISTEHLDLDIPENIDLFGRFQDGYDRFRFPGPLCRVTGGHGGEAILIIGNDKTVLIDCGMAYAGPVTVDNLRKVLGREGRELDYVLLSHSHYDHIGALPYIRDAYPRAEVMGSSHCARVLQREGARKLMKELGETARELYAPGSRVEITTDGLYADRVLDDGSQLCIGAENGENIDIIAIDTPGHTDCSMSFYLKPLGLLFTSESTGILEGDDYVHTPCLKSFIQGLDSVEKCRRIGASHLCLPHFGMVPDGFTAGFWDMFIDECRSKTMFIADMMRRGLNEGQMLAEYVDRYWTSYKEAEQPREAFELNSGYILKTLVREHGELKVRLGI